MRYFHTLHTCNHAVYWSDADLAMRCSAFACPWCGGESGPKVPSDQNEIALSGIGDKPAFVFRDLIDGLPPVPDDGRSKREKVYVHHMAGDACCTGVKQ